jgi:hypothetical protein
VKSLTTVTVFFNLTAEHEIDGWLGKAAAEPSRAL